MVIRKYTRFFLIVFIFIAFIFKGIGQSIVISGKIFDADTNEPLVGANIVSNTNKTTSDNQGSFTLNVTIGDSIYVHYLSYFTLGRIISPDPLVTFYLAQQSNVLSTATVTTSRFSQRLAESSVSIDVMKPGLIKNTNTVAIDDVLNKVSGVQMVDGQANIRGGSGYSYGAGSRVMLLLDNLPALQTDAGFPNWGDIPIENIGQVEVVKGSASALYGSSALNGIINIRSARPKLKPETEIAIGYTSFFSPKDVRKKWWEGASSPYGVNASIVHRRKTEKFELTGSLFYNKLESFNKDTYDDRQRVTFGLRYNLKQNLNIGVNTNFNLSKTGSFFIWATPATGAHTPYPGSASTADSKRYMIDPYLNYYDSKGGIHKIMSRYLNINNDNSGGQSNASKMLYLEYQYQKELKDLGLNLTAGGLFANTNTDAELFGDTTFNNKNSAIYLQLDKQFDKLSLSLGSRYEYNRQKSPENFMGQIIPDGINSDGRPIFRAGLNYKLHEYSSIRASWGQGYRFPTITERFITTTFSGFLIFPNVNLKPESGWTSEVGIKQGLSVLGFKGFIDLAAFISEYDDMMEFTLVNMGGLGFQSQNIGNTRIKGLELSVYGQAKIGPVPINIIGGYMVLDPVYKDFNEVVQASSSSSENILKYRSRNNYKLDMEGFYKGFNLGIAIESSSHVIAIDAALRLLPGAGIEDYRNLHNTGYSVLGARIGYDFKDFKLTANLKNLLNSEYTVRPALLEAPRNLSLRLDYSL